MPAESTAPMASAAGPQSSLSSADIAFRDRLLAINTPALADANKEGLRVMDHRLRPLNKNPIQFAGIARTVRCYNDFLTVRACYAACDRYWFRDETLRCCAPAWERRSLLLSPTRSRVKSS